MTRLIKNYVAGEFVDSNQHFTAINPVDGTPSALVAEASESDVDRAMQAARQAVEGEWGQLPPAERAQWMNKIAGGIEQRFEDFVRAEIDDTGRPVQQARTLDVPRAAANFRFFADLIKTANTDCFQTYTAEGPALNYTIRKPLGVVSAISPWNLPILLFTWKVAPALAMGNAVVAKPSEEAPSSAALLAEVAHDVGLPKGALSILHGFGPGSTGEFMTQHPEIDAVTFTGESRTGSAIMKTVADGVKEISFELGGKNAAIVFADADFDAAVAGIVRSAFTNAGQVCLCTERVYIERPIFDRFVRALKEKTEAIRIGSPWDEHSEMGPLISHEHRDKVLSYLHLAREENATVVSGGEIPHFGDQRDNGAWIRPTIWTGLSDNARCMQEEVFGPVCHVAPFDSEEEVIARANGTAYGLAAAIWTQNLQRGHRVAHRMHTGLVWLNSWYLRDLRSPFGGVRLSGIGREGGQYSLDYYSSISNICVKL